MFMGAGIEFCIGMAIKDDRYIFWVSTFDRDVCMIMVPMVDSKFRWFDIIT